MFIIVAIVFGWVLAGVLMTPDSVKEARYAAKQAAKQNTLRRQRPLGWIFFILFLLIVAASYLHAVH